MQLPEPGDVIDGKYRIVRPLGHGGFAGTYLAEDVKDASSVVLKVPDITQLGDPAVYERFRRELSIGKMLQHPDLSVAIDSSEGTPPYLVFRYLEGDTLSALLDGGKSFTAEESVKMVANLLDALAVCHKAGVCHRDIKPENLILGADKRLKIIDFGIAMTANSPRVTWRGFSGLVGTPEYMSPEQIKGDRGDEKSDIYAVGCLLYHMVSGHPPYSGDNPMTTMYQHLTASPKHLAGVDPAIQACILHAMRRRKDERYATAQEMADDLRHLDKVDQKWLTLPDPPMVAVAQSKSFNKNIWIVIGVVAAAAVGLGLLVYFLNK